MILILMKILICNINDNENNINDNNNIINVY